MSRSNPTTNAPNPAVRFFEWNGEHGHPRYYDKAEKRQVDLPADFAFILLDQLATVKGWHEPSESGIFANEVRDTRTEPMTVKAFKGGELAKGLYSAIRDTVAAHGGHFTANCYIAFKNQDGKLQIGSIQFKGAALSAWFEFVKANRNDLYKQAIRIKGYTEGKKGKVTYRVPTFHIAPISEEADAAAKALDVELQTYLAGYFDRTKASNVAQDAGASVPDENPFHDDQQGDATISEEQALTGGKQSPGVMRPPPARTTETVGSYSGSPHQPIEEEDIPF